MTDFVCKIVRCSFLFVAYILLVATWSSASDRPSTFDALQNGYQRHVHALLKQFCLECHSTQQKEGELDLERFQQFSDVRRDPPAWQKVARMLDDGEMPPEGSPQFTPEQKRRLRDWVAKYLDAESHASAGDPGPVVLRRLNNAEYNYTIRDLTGVETLAPTHQFPVDGAASEGFTNTGAAQGMSPSLVTKYLEAAKVVAQHAVLLPDGIRFSPHTTRRDRADAMVVGIREFYRRFTDVNDGTHVNLGDNIKFTTNRGGRLPLGEYVKATLFERDELSGGKKTVDEVADERGLSAKYLGSLWEMLTAETSGKSLLLDDLRTRWQSADLDDASEIAAHIVAWQKVLWKFNRIGHVGRIGKPASWQEAAVPVIQQQQYEWKLPVPTDGHDVVFYLTAGDTGDGNESDYVVWKNPRLEGGLRPLALRDIAGVHQRLSDMRRETLAQTIRYLAAAAEAKLVSNAELSTLAADHEVDARLLRFWLDYLQVGVREQLELKGLFTNKVLTAQGYDFVKSWGTDETPIVQANSSDREVRIPGIAKPHSVYAHPSPTLFVAIGWRSPIEGVVRVEARIADAHPDCGNGQEWAVQHRTASRDGNLWQGEFDRGGSATIPEKTIAIRKGELVSVLVGPRNGQYGCDLTEVDFSITEADGEQRVWNLAKDVSDNILESNPHADRQGNKDIWYFYKGAMDGVNLESNEPVSVPAGSLLASWQAEQDVAKRQLLAERVQQLALGDPPADKNSPDGLLYGQLQALSAGIKTDDLLINVQPDDRFGKHPLGAATDAADLVVKAPAVVEFRVPAEFAAGQALKVTAQLEPKHGREGSVQLQVGTTRVDPHNVMPGIPFVLADSEKTSRHMEGIFDDFRNLFPHALCFETIVPIDEIVTLALYHREDDHLKRLILNDAQTARIDRLWDELYFVSHEPIALAVALEQILEFSTQTNPKEPAEWRPLSKPINARADAFRQRLIETEPVHVKAVLEFAERAWRRQLTDVEHQGLRALYRSLRDSEISHDAAIRLTLARVLTSPAFLYKREIAAPGKKSAPVSNFELATRLSYFLWSSLPDEELRDAAEAGRLKHDEVLLAQARRMLTDARTRRLAIQFACQWLHLRDFDQNDDKNEKLYPEFSELRHDMYEETVRFFEHMFRKDGSILDIINADHTFLNEAIAGHYGIPWDGHDAWQRVDGVHSHGRGGILGMASYLASQSGASRTSPILRGNWIFETLLGERLPRPPADVPQLPDEVPKNLTARQLIEHHSSVAECAKCHARIDPYGFSLEQYDAIGRRRLEKVDTQTTLVDGKSIDGFDGLRDYLANDRRDDLVRQFCRKLLGYALGREVLLSDTPLLNEMQMNMDNNNFRFSVAVDAIITSKQFVSIRGRENAYNK